MSSDETPEDRPHGQHPNPQPPDSQASDSQPPDPQPPDPEPSDSKPPVDPRIEARRNNVHARRRLRVWITVGIIVVLLAVGFGVTQSPLLDVDEVEVIGARRTGADSVLEAAGIEPGRPLLGLDLSGPRRSIAELPWVYQVRSSRTWGGKVTFDVTERTAVAQIPVDGGWAAVDLDGRVLQINPASGTLPVVLFSPVPEPGEWLMASALPLLEVSEALIPLQDDEIGAISWIDGQLIVDLPGPREARWGGRDDPQGKAIALATFLARVDLNCYEMIDLSIPELPALTPIDDCP